RALLAQSRFAEAIQVAEKLIARRPRFTPAYNNAADACYFDGRLAQAIDLEQRLLAVDPNNVFGLSNLVRCLCVLGRLDEARQQMARLQAITPIVKDQALKQAEAFAWLSDDAGVLSTCARARHLPATPGDSEEPLLNHLAAVASCRLGHETEARTL